VVPNLAYHYSTRVLLSVKNPILLSEKQYKITVPNAEFVQAVSEAIEYPTTYVGGQSAVHT
jgi:hypothetical protein